MNCIRHSSWRIRFGLIIFFSNGSIQAWNACSQDNGGGICPDRNVCCPIADTIGVSACISESEQLHNGTGTCCGDKGATGCGPEYSCSVDGLICILNSSNLDFEPRILPSYRLCSVSNPSWRQIRSFAIEPDNPQLAYYSTADINHNPNIRTALIVIHGSGRNSDDYLCCGISSVPPAFKDSTIVIAPTFLTYEDGQMPTPVPLLRWNETDPMPHTWRYGADAINANISSYRALDAFIETMMDRTPSLENLIVAGHSAGGQFTQRWALTSGSNLWERSLPIRVVVANPRSFCYLDGRRFFNTEFRTPDESTISQCPGYNRWEWGLDQGGRLPTPYFDRALEQVGGKEQMVRRFSTRNVIYLAGELDTLQIRSECESDDFQGPTRRARSELFYESLKRIYGTEQVRHRRILAKGIPHDHCLLFQSLAGQEALFGEFHHSNDSTVPNETMVSIA